MDGKDATIRLIEALESAHVDYMVVGSLSSNYHGVARSTKDADIVVSAPSADLRQALAPLSPQLQMDRQLTFETATGTTRHIVNVQDSPFRIELFRLSQDPHDQERFLRRRRVFDPALGRDVFIATAEDVVIMKLRWAVNAARNKDRDDARDVIGVCGDDLDWEYLWKWTEAHGSRSLLEEIRASLPPSKRTRESTDSYQNQKGQDQ